MEQIKTKASLKKKKQNFIRDNAGIARAHTAELVSSTLEGAF